MTMTDMTTNGGMIVLFIDGQLVYNVISTRNTLVILFTM